MLYREIFVTEGVFWYKFIYTFGAEGAREAMSKVWFALIITYIIQVVFAKIRNEKPKLPIPRNGFVRKEQNGSAENQPKMIPSIKAVPIKPSTIKNTPPVQKTVAPTPAPKKLIVKQNETKNNEHRSETTTSKKLQKRINVEDFFK